MSAIFAERVRVRAYECDSLGHLNNAVYIQYLLQTTLDAAGVAAYFNWLEEATFRAA
jgi:hypothetical protein